MMGLIDAEVPFYDSLKRVVRFQAKLDGRAVKGILE